MKNSLRRSATGLLLLVAAVLLVVAGEASRPSASDVAVHRCQNVMRRLGQTLETLNSAQMFAMTGRRHGVQLVDGRVLRYLMQHDDNAINNPLYDEIMEVEKGVSQCRYYFFFDLDRQIFERNFMLLDNRHGFIYEYRDDKFSAHGPRSTFFELCNLYETRAAYDEFSEDFLEETEATKKFKLAQARDVGIVALLARYWYLILIFGFIDFVFVDLSYMKGEHFMVKLYGLGLHLVGIMVGLSIVLIHYTGTPVPGLRDFSHLPSGSYPHGIHFLGDVVLAASFSWWAISLVAVGVAEKFSCSSFVPLVYSLAGPITLAMSESPFGGTQRIAFPVFGLVVILINAIYIKLKYQKKDSENANDFGSGEE